MAVRGDAAADGFIRTTNLPSITAFTMMGWFRVTTAPGNATWANALTFGHASSDQFYGFQISGDAPCAIDLWAGGDAGTGSSLNLNTWYHLTMVVDGTGAGNARIYVNGVLDVSGAGNGSITAGSMYIGNDSFNEFWNGRWKAVKVWNAALSVAEIQAEMHRILPRRLANLNGWSPCFPGATERAADYSGQGNNWTQNGTLADEDDPPVSWGGSGWSVPFVASGGGGTTYFQSVGGTITPSGTLSRRTNKGLSGGISPAATLSRQTARLLAGSLTPGGTLAKRTDRALAGSLSLTGALQTTKVALKSLVGAITPSGTLDRRVGKAAGGSIAPSGAIAKRTGRALVGSITPQGTVVKEARKSFVGGITPSGVLARVKVALQSVAGSIGLSGTVATQHIEGEPPPEGGRRREGWKALFARRRRL